MCDWHTVSSPKTGSLVSPNCGCWCVHSRFWWFHTLENIWPLIDLWSGKREVLMEKFTFQHEVDWYFDLPTIPNHWLNLFKNSDDKDYYWAFQHSHPLFVYLFFNPDIMTLRHRLEKSFALLLLWKKPSKSGDVFWSGHFQTETQVDFFLLTKLWSNRGLFSSEEMAELKKCFDTKGFQVGASATGSSQTSAN